jgi:hypothetical protein
MAALLRAMAPVGSANRSRRVACCLCLSAGVLCSLVSYGELSTIDARIMLDAARHLATASGFTVDPALGVIKGIDGRFYSLYGPANSLLMVPFVWIAGAAQSAGSLPIPTSFVEEFLCATAGAWIKAAAVTLSFLLLQQLEDAPRRNALAAFGALLMGYDFQYARSYFAELPVAVCLLAAIWALETARTRPPARQALLAGTALAAATLFRWETVVFAPVIALLAWWPYRIAIGRRTVVSFLAPLVPTAIALALYNHVRFGSVLKTGYEHFPFSSSPLRGWVEMLVAPGGGFLWFAPWCLSLLFVRPRSEMWRDRKLRDLSVAVLAMIAVAWPIYGSWMSWSGGQAWGPRFLTPFVPMLAIPCVLVWRRHRWAGRVGLVLATACVAMNAMLLVSPQERFRAYATMSGWSDEDRMWSLRRTPWLYLPSMAADVGRTLPHVRKFSARARERVAFRSTPRAPEPLDAREALDASVSLNVPAIWWIKLLVIGAPLWLSLGIGVSGSLLLAALLREASGEASQPRVVDM